MNDNETIQVADAPERSQFEVTVDGELAGVARYVRRGARLMFVHTEIDPQFEGRGLGSKLAAGALDQARRERETVVPLCPFISSYIAKHPEYLQMVDRELLARFEETVR